MVGGVASLSGQFTTVRKGRVRSSYFKHGDPSETEQAQDAFVLERVVGVQTVR